MFIKALAWSGVLSLLVTLSHLVPFNVPVLLLFIPLTFVFPQLAETGPDVTYGFLWLEIHARWVWITLFTWHFVLLFPVCLLTLYWWRVQLAKQANLVKELQRAVTSSSVKSTSPDRPPTHGNQ